MNENLKTSEHKLELYARKDIKVSGVIEVISATPTEIVTKTDCGPLCINGQHLKVKNLLINERILEAEGEIYKIEYSKSKKTLFAKILK